MNAFFYLASCDTCRKIMKSLPNLDKVALREIKSEPMTPAELDHLKQLAGSYEALFSRKAQLYKSLQLKDKNLVESDYRNYILQHYTFLSRPVLVTGSKILIGNKPQTVAAMAEALG
ncbi:MAG: hypothetical protein EOO51_06710 [Flavobacterium sp.]|nr:MAG: hypothetical protein EOO51_06710 [Flavobacterium sp.]